jgi:hypothetical protein
MVSHEYHNNTKEMIERIEGHAEEVPRQHCQGVRYRRQVVPGKLVADQRMTLAPLDLVPYSQFLDSMTQWMWIKARAVFVRLSYSTRKRRRERKDIHYVDLGAGNGAAARWICKQDATLCINISPAER